MCRASLAKLERPTTARGDFEQAAEPVGRVAGDRAGAEQIAGPKIAAAAGMMGDKLRDRPVEMARIAGCEPLRSQALRLQAPRAQEYFKLDVEGAGCLIGWIEQVGEGCGIL